MGGVVHTTLALRPYPHPHPSLPRGLPSGRRRERGSTLRCAQTVIPQPPRWNPSPSGSTRGGHRDVPGFEERGRWRQPDEGAGGAVRITVPLRPYPHPHPSPRGRGALRCAAHRRLFLSLQDGTLLPPGARGERTWMCAALRSEEGGGSRMRVRAEQCTSLLRSARTLTPTPLPAGEGFRNVADRAYVMFHPCPDNSSCSASC